MGKWSLNIKQRIIQAFPGVWFGCAVTHHILELHYAFERYGYNSIVISELIDKNLPEKDIFLNPDNIDFNSGDILIYHYSGAHPLGFQLGKLPCRKIIVYHNVTPPVFFVDYSEPYKNSCIKSRQEIFELSFLFQEAWADSGYNASCLRKMGFDNIKILPIPYKKSKSSAIPNASIIEKYAHTNNILFVGRIVPNKKQEDIVRAFYYYRKNVPNSRLFLIGGCYPGLEKYKDMLVSLIDSLGLNDFVIMPGKASSEDLEAYWKSASLFLCMSEHEGFCVPILEALAHEIPVLAYSSSAIPETLGKAGLLFNKKNFSSVAEAMNAIIENNELVSFFKKTGMKHISKYSPGIIGEMAVNYISNVRDETN